VYERTIFISFSSWYWIDSDPPCIFCSMKQDDIFVVYISNDDVSVLESKFKTEFLTVLAKHYKALTKRELVIEFRDVYVSVFIVTGNCVSELFLADCACM